MNEPEIDITGNLGSDPSELKDVEGQAVTNFRLGATPRVKDGRGGYKDGDTLWYDIAVWGHLAENVTTVLLKGDRVRVSGIVRDVRAWSANGKEGVTTRVTARAVSQVIPNWPIPGTARREPEQQEDRPWYSPGQNATTTDDIEIPF